jgi:hypothetical protein
MSVLLVQTKKKRENNPASSSNPNIELVPVRPCPPD